MKFDYTQLIYTEKNTLPIEFCDNIIDKFEKDDRKRAGKVRADMVVNQTIKQSLDLLCSTYPEYDEETEVFNESLQEGLIKYAEVLYEGQVSKWAEPLTKGALVGTSHEGYQLQRTQPGKGYTWHDDGAYRRMITFIWYLNDIHEDGYTEFLNGTKVQPEQGKLLLFPANWMFQHRGYPPKSELKYICTGWLLSQYGNK